MPFQLLRQPRYLLTLIIGSLSGALLAAMIFIPAFSEQVLGIASENAGYWMTPLALAAGMGAAMGGMFTDKRGPIFAVILSSIISAIGFLLFPLWIEVKWHFIVASIIGGFGMGIILGAPLNMLATEKLQSNKGSALATLSLTRTLGMTIAPTIYAGFIARGYNEMPALFKNDFPKILQDNLAQVELSQAGANELQQLTQQMSSGAAANSDMSQLLTQIQDPTLKEVLTSSVQQVSTLAAQNGYGGLFTSAVVIAVCILIVTLFLAPLRKKSLQA